jgi:hypothetical protein
MGLRRDAPKASRIRDVWDLEVAGQDGAVPEQAAKERLLDLEGRPRAELDRGRAAADDAVDDEQLVLRHHDLRPIPPEDGTYRGEGADGRQDRARDPERPRDRLAGDDEGDPPAHEHERASERAGENDAVPARLVEDLTAAAH